LIAEVPEFVNDPEDDPALVWRGYVVDYPIYQESTASGHHLQSIGPEVSGE
jgi:hypothetical protein